MSNTESSNAAMSIRAGSRLPDRARPTIENRKVPARGAFGTARSGLTEFSAVWAYTPSFSAASASESDLAHSGFRASSVGEVVPLTFPPRQRGCASGLFDVPGPLALEVCLYHAAPP